MASCLMAYMSFVREAEGLKGEAQLQFHSPRHSVIWLHFFFLVQSSALLHTTLEIF